MDDATRRLQALLAPLTNYERTRPDRPRFTLDTMRALNDRLGDAVRLAGRAIQIGGSKGKGTTAAYVDALARAAGLRTGVYASPHVSSILERVRIDGRDVNEDVLMRACRRVLEAGRGLEPSPSFFEVMTGAALVAFAAAGVDVAALEVGLGGRLDATTAVDVDASIVTSIELEHTELLGDTIAAIAAEKAFVLRPGRVGLHACDGVAAEVLERRAREVGCRLLALGRDFGVEVVDGDERVRRLRLTAADGAVAETGLHGAPPWEDRALALAWGVLRELFPAFPLPPVVGRPFLPGRFEVHVDDDGEALVLDGGHTAAAAALVAGELGRRFPGRAARMLCGSARGKRWRQALGELLPVVDRFFVIGVTGIASEDPAVIAAWLRERGAVVEVVPDADAGLARLRDGPGPRVVTGSFYLVGEIRDRIGASDPPPGIPGR